MSQFRGETIADPVFKGSKITVITKPFAATTVPTTIFLADDNYEVVAASYVYTHTSTSGTLQLEKCTGTTAPGSGLALQTGTFDETATANTVQDAVIVTATPAYTQVAKGDRLSLKTGGDHTGLTGGAITVTLKRA